MRGPAQASRWGLVVQVASMSFLACGAIALMVIVFSRPQCSPAVPFDVQSLVNSSWSISRKVKAIRSEDTQRTSSFVHLDSPSGALPTAS